MLLPFLLSVLTAPSHAASGPHMWGVGPAVSTIVYPGSYPGDLPHFNEDIDSLSGMLDDDPESTMDKTKGDFALAGRGLLYLKNKQRLGARLQMGFGGGMTMTNFTLEYEQSLLREDNINIFAGGGLGVGALKFSQADASTGTNVLSLNTYIARGQVSAIYRDKQGKKNKADDRAYELSLYAILFAHGPESFRNDDKGIDVVDPDSFTLFASDEDEQQKLKGGSYSPFLGLEATIFFGDFTAPKN